MSLNVFFTLCILGIDFMVYALFQWTYGDKQRKILRKIAAIRSSSEPRSARPLLVDSKKPILGRFQTPLRAEDLETTRSLQSV